MVKQTHFIFWKVMETHEFIDEENILESVKNDLICRKPTLSMEDLETESLIKGVARRASIHGHNVGRIIRNSFHSRSLTLGKKPVGSNRRQSYYQLQTYQQDFGLERTEIRHSKSKIVKVSV